MRTAADTSGADTRRSDYPALSWWVLIVLVLYVVAAGVLLCSPLLTPERRLLLSTWSTLPAQSALVACGWVLVRSARLTRERRLAWSFVMAALSLNLAGSALWMWEWTVSGGVAPHTSHVSYLLSYVPLGVIGLYFFLRNLGGSVRHPGALLDALALTLGFGAILWCFVIVPTTPTGAGALTILDIATRSAVLIFPAVFAGIVYTHVVDWSTERGLACLLVAAVLNLCGDMLWASATAPAQLDQAIAYNLVFLVANIVGMLALCLESRRRTQAARPVRATSCSLVPAMVMLGCMTAVVATGMPMTAAEHRFALGMLMAALVALAVRESLAYRERRRLDGERAAASALLGHEAAERLRLFEQVHEGVAQELVGLRLSLTASANDPDAAAQSVRSAIDQLGQTIASTREIAMRLAPVQSMHGSLRHALVASQAQARRAGLPCRLDLGDGDLECAPVVAELVHRLVLLVVEAARADVALRSLHIGVVAIGEALSIEVRADSQSLPRIVHDHAEWAASSDRLRVAGGDMAEHATAGEWRYSVRLPRLPVVATDSVGSR